MFSSLHLQWPSVTKWSKLMKSLWLCTSMSKYSTKSNKSIKWSWTKRSRFRKLQMYNHGSKRNRWFNNIKMKLSEGLNKEVWDPMIFKCQMKRFRKTKLLRRFSNNFCKEDHNPSTIVRCSNWTTCNSRCNNSSNNTFIWTILDSSNSNSICKNINNSNFKLKVVVCLKTPKRRWRAKV